MKRGTIGQLPLEPPHPTGGGSRKGVSKSPPPPLTMSSDERPIGAAKGKQSDTEALCQTPPHHPQPFNFPKAKLISGRCC